MEVLLQLGAKHSLKFHLSPPWDTERYVLSSLITFQREGSGSWERPSWVVKLLKGFQKLLNIKRAEKNFAVTSFLKRILLMKGFLRLLLFSCSVLSNSLLPYWLQHARHPCPSPSPGACSNSCPLSRWWHPTISSSVIPFFSFLQSFPASGSFPKSLLFTSDGQSIGASASASVFSMNIQGWFPVGLTGLILLSKGLSRVFSSTTIQKHQLFGTQPSLWSNSHICTWLLEKTLLWLYGPLLAKWCLCFLICCLGLSWLFFQGAVGWISRIFFLFFATKSIHLSPWSTF